MNGDQIDSRLGNLPIFPLPGIVLFPHTVLPLHIFEPRYRAMVRDARKDALPIAMAQIDASAPPPEKGELPRVHSVAGVGMLRGVRELPDGRFLIELQGCARVRLVEELPLDKPYRRVSAVRLEEPPASQGAREQIDVLRGMLLGLRESHDFSRQLLTLLSHNDSPRVIADVAAHLLVSDSEIRQDLLEELDPEKRLRIALDCLSELLVPSLGRTGIAN